MIKYIKADRSDYEAWEKIYRFDLALLSPNSDYRKIFREKSILACYQTQPSSGLSEAQYGKIR